MVRLLMPMPYKYIPLMLGQLLYPKQLWATLSGAIMGNNKEAACTPLLNVLWVALVQSAPGQVSHVATLMPGFIAADEALQRDRLRLLVWDLAGRYDPNQVNVGVRDALREAVNSFDARTQVLVRQQQQDQVAAKNKTPSDRWRVTYMLACKIQQRDDKMGLHQLYYNLANAKKGEDRAVLQERYNMRAMEAGAATKMAPLCTQDVATAFFSCRPHSVDPLNLTTCVSVFVCSIFTPEDLAEHIKTLKLFDLQQQGQHGTSQMKITAVSEKIKVRSPKTCLRPS